MDTSPASPAPAPSADVTPTSASKPPQRTNSPRRVALALEIVAAVSAAAAAIAAVWTVCLTKTISNAQLQVAQQQTALSAQQGAIEEERVHAELIGILTEPDPTRLNFERDPPEKPLPRGRTVARASAAQRQVAWNRLIALWDRWSQQPDKRFDKELRGAYLDGVTLCPNGRTTRVDLRNANLHDAVLAHADLSNVDFSGADLEYADFRWAFFENRPPLGSSTTRLLAWHNQDMVDRMGPEDEKQKALKAAMSSWSTAPK